MTAGVPSRHRYSGRVTWKWAAPIAAALVLSLAGCSAAPAPEPTSSPTQPASATTAPPGGVLLSALGFTNAPPGFSIPADSFITDRIDAGNNVTLILTAPAGIEIAGYLREHLPAMGFEITADKNQSLLFHSATHDGAFTTSGSTAALSLRTDH